MAFDREFALVDTSGSAMRLHSYPKMSEIRSHIDLDTNILTVTAPNREDLIINLEKPSTSDNIISPENIQVCGNMCKGNVWGGSKASSWFSSVLGVRCWLARHYDAGETEKMSLDENKQFAYYNEASLLLVSQQSISYLNSVITSQGWGRLVESRHFRPNIVVTSTFRGDSVVAEKPFGESQEEVANPEDSWQQIIIRGSIDVVELIAVGKCARCQMVDINPSSGMKGNTLRALAQYRRDRGRINFGTFFAGNVDASEGTAWLEEGSVVEPGHS
jgi:molybdenum cofactor sulfurtransferase